MSEPKMSEVTVTFTPADVDRAQAAHDSVMEHFSHSAGDCVRAFLDELPRPYIEHAQTAKLAFVGYRSPYREWFDAPDRERGDVPPDGLSDLIGEFNFSSENDAQVFRAAVRGGIEERV